MKLTLGFSPCPNDTFIFDALVNGKIPGSGLEFEVVLEDVQTLNEWAQQGRLDVTKISYGVLPLITSHYGILKAGGALGKGVGPLLIASQNLYPLSEDASKEIIRHTPVAIPGRNTTAHFLFSQAYPEAENKVFLRFDAVEDWVLAGNGFGVIIHENRFTYAQRGLHMVADLGNLWERQTGLPIPLGGIAARKSIPPKILAALNDAIKKSIASAWDTYPALSDYVKSNAQEMEESVMREHIELYVNDFSMDMHQSGRDAIVEMMKVMDRDGSWTEESIFL